MVSSFISGNLIQKDAYRRFVNLQVRDVMFDKYLCIYFQKESILLADVVLRIVAPLIAVLEPQYKVTLKKEKKHPILFLKLTFL